MLRYSVTQTLAPKPSKKYPFTSGLFVINDYKGRELVMSAGTFYSNLSCNEHNMALTHMVGTRDGIVEGSFRMARTDETLTRLAAEVIAEGRMSPLFYSSSRVYLGRVLFLPGGRLVINPPMLDNARHSSAFDIDIEGLGKRLASAEEFDGVRFSEEGFACIDGFATGDMCFEAASRNKLIRALESSQERAQKFLSINLEGEFGRGVRIQRSLTGAANGRAAIGFAVLYSGRTRGVNKDLNVVCDSWSACDIGHSYGVLKDAKILSQRVAS